MSNFQPSPIPDASGSLRGLVNAAAQTFSGAKTFAASVNINNAGSLTIAQPGINTPAINLPAGTGGYGYGGSISWGAFDKIYFDSSALYVQGYASPVEIRSWNSGSIISGYTTGTLAAADVAVKVGTKIIDGATSTTSKLFSVRTGLGLGAGETEYVYVSRGPLGGGILNIDCKTQTHVAGITIYNNGAGDTGLNFGGWYSGGGSQLGIGDGFFAMKSYARSLKFTQGSNSYSGLASPAFLFEAAQASNNGNILDIQYQGGTTLILSSSGVIKSPYALIVSGSPTSGSSLTPGVAAAVGSYNANIGASALWLNIAAGSFTPSTTNYALAAAASTGLDLLPGLTLNSGGKLYVQGGNGTGASDVVVQLGTRVADASLNSAAKLLSVGAGMANGGTYVEHMAFKPFGAMVGHGGVAIATLNSTYGARMDYGVNMIGATPTGVTMQAGSGGGLATVVSAMATGSADIAVKVGTSIANVSASTAPLLSVRTGIGGSEVEYFSISKGASLTLPVAKVTVPVETNRIGMLITGGSSGWGGYWYQPIGLGVVAFGNYSNTSPGVVCENWGMAFLQNSNTYGVADLMSFTVSTAAMVTSSIPAFNFSAPTNLDFFQPAYRLKIGTQDAVKVMRDGQFIAASSNGTGSTDVAVKLGTVIGDASVNTGAKLLSIRSGISGSETEYASFSKGASGGFVLGSGASLGSLSIDSSVGTRLSWNNASWVTFDSAQGAMYGATNSRIQGGVANSSTAVANIINTGNTLSTVGAKILSIQNNGTEKIYVDKDGGITHPSQLILYASGTGGVMLSSQGSNICQFSAGGAVAPLVNVSYSIYMNAGSLAGIQWGSTSAGMRLGTEVADSTTAKGLIVNSINVWNSNGAKLVSVRNADVEKLYVDKSGSLGAVSASLTLMSDLGVASTDVAVKLGTVIGDASVNTGAKLLSVGTGIGGTYTEKLYVDKSGKIGPTQAWQNFTYSGAWASLSSAQYMKDALGFVHFRGVVYLPTGAPTAGDPIFTMPAGYKPGNAMVYVTRTNSGSANGLETLDSTTGQFQYSLGAWGYIYLDQIPPYLAEG